MKMREIIIKVFASGNLLRHSSYRLETKERGPRLNWRIRLSISNPSIFIAWLGKVPLRSHFWWTCQGAIPGSNLFSRTNYLDFPSGPPSYPVKTIWIPQQHPPQKPEFNEQKSASERLASGNYLHKCWNWYRGTQKGNPPIPSGSAEQSKCKNESFHP